LISCFTSVIDSYRLSSSAGKRHHGAHLPLQQDPRESNMRRHGSTTSAFAEALRRRGREKGKRSRALGGLVQGRSLDIAGRRDRGCLGACSDRMRDVDS